MMSTLEAIRGLDIASPTDGAPYGALGTESAETNGLDFFSLAQGGIFCAVTGEGGTPPVSGALSRVYPPLPAERVYPPLVPARVFPL